MRILEDFCRLIDWVNKKMGEVLGYLALGLTISIFYEVISRYIFNSPTTWAYDVSIYFVGLMVMLAGGYALLENAHVAIDVFAERLPSRAKKLIDLLLDIILLFSVGILLWKGWNQALYSIKINEHYTSLLSPPIYPLKMAIPVGAFLLLLQGLAKTIRDFLNIINREAKC